MKRCIVCGDLINNNEKHNVCEWCTMGIYIKVMNINNCSIEELTKYRVEKVVKEMLEDMSIDDIRLYGAELFLD